MTQHHIGTVIDSASGYSFPRRVESIKIPPFDFAATMAKFKLSRLNENSSGGSGHPLT